MKRTFVIALIAAFPVVALLGCATEGDISGSEKTEFERVTDTPRFAEGLKTSVKLLFIGCQGRLEIPAAFVEQNLSRIQECAEGQNRVIGLESRSRLDEGLLKLEEVPSFAIDAAVRFAQNNNDKAAVLSPEELIAFAKRNDNDVWPVLPD